MKKTGYKVHILAYYILFFSLFSVFSFSVLYDQTEYQKKTNEIIIALKHTNNNLIDAESIEIFSRPTKEKAEIIFSETPSDIYLYKEKKFIKVITKNTEIKAIFKNATKEIRALDTVYKTIDQKNNLISKEKALSIKIDHINNYPLEQHTDISKENNETLIKENYAKSTEKNIPTEENIFKRAIAYSKDMHFLIFAFFSFIFGLLMSFTPCIYPMIPITIAVLGIDKQPLRKKILSASFYVLGIALTFSILGLFASSGKLFFGALFNKSWFLVIVIAFLTLMTFNMLGLTDFSLISFDIQNKLPQSIRNSLFLPFFYGIFSGTISSPCVSPGLFALLSLVAEQGNLFIGWLWLFFFGIGLGFPLWLIALVIDQAAIFPKSGAWMTQLKEIIGLILLCIVYKHATTLMGWYSVFYILLLFVFFIIKKNKARSWTALAGIVILGVLATNSFKLHAKKNQDQSLVKHKIDWIYDLTIAQNIAEKENKFLLIDFTADWCTACRKLDKDLFEQEATIALQDTLVFCKVNCTKDTQETRTLMDRYHIQGLPTLLLIKKDQEKEIIHRFGSEIDIYAIKKIVCSKDISIC